MTIQVTRRAIAALALGTATLPLAHAASPLPLPTGKVILTVSGQISIINKDGNAEFDFAMLEALGIDRFETVTRWYSGPVRFEGVRMQRLMQAVGAYGESLVATSLNDYTSELTIADFERDGLVLAMKRDANDMPLRDKGSLFIVYTYDSKPGLKAQKFYARSALQVARLRQGLRQAPSRRGLAWL